MLRVTYSKPNVHHFSDAIRLLPGLNVITHTTPEQEQEFLDHPQIKEKIKSGVIKVTQTEGRQIRAEVEEGIEGDEKDVDESGLEKDEAREDDTVDPRPVKEILADLPEVVDIAYLRALTLDKRSTVSAAAQKRLDKVIAESDPIDNNNGGGDAV